MAKSDIEANPVSKNGRKTRPMDEWLFQDQPARFCMYCIEFALSAGKIEGLGSKPQLSHMLDTRQERLSNPEDSYIATFQTTAHDYAQSESIQQL